MKNLKNLGEILNKQEQQSINGGHATCNYHCNRPNQPDHILCSCGCHPNPQTCFEIKQ